MSPDALDKLQMLQPCKIRIYFDVHPCESVVCCPSTTSLHPVVSVYFIFNRNTLTTSCIVHACVCVYIYIHTYIHIHVHINAISHNQPMHIYIYLPITHIIYTCLPVYNPTGYLGWPVQAALGAHERMTSNRRVARLARKVKERWKAMDDATKEQMLYRKATRRHRFSGNEFRSSRILSTEYET